MNIKSLANFFESRKLTIILFWIGFTIIVSVFFAPDFIDRTKSEFDPPSGSDAAKASNLLKKYFPEKAEEISHIIVAYNKDSTILTQDFADFTFNVIKEMNSTFNSEFINVAGYFVFHNTGLDSVKYEFVSDDGSTSIIVFNFAGKVDNQQDIVIHLREYIDEQKLSFKAYTTGIAALSTDTNESIASDMARIDAIVIPLVFLALIIILRNWKYFPITMLPILMTIGISFGILERYIFYSDATVQSFVPSVIISIVLGVGVDYNLFLLTRFREERLNGSSVLESVTTMLKYAGHTVFTSGLTLTISLAGLVLFPITSLSSVGISIVIGILVLLAINLTFTPALLLLFGTWIEKSPQTIESEEPNITKKEGRWYRIGKFATKYNYMVLLVILLLTLPFAFQLMNTTANGQMNFFAPRGSDSAKGFELLQENFGPGSIGPTQLVINPNIGNIWSDDVFDAIHSFIRQTIDQTIIKEFDFSSHAWLNGTKIELIVALTAIQPSSIFYNVSQSVLYRQFAAGYVNSMEIDANASLVEIIMPVDPASPEAGDLLKVMKKIAKNIFKTGFTYGFTGFTASNSQSIESTFELFPLMIILVIISIYALVGIMFKAVILPARLIATIALTIAFIYGAATVVFEYDTFLNDIFPILDDISVTFWMVPVMSFSIILGLGIDYDIFTIERIKENIWNGMENDEAIARGIEKTGKIITGAGLIMMIAFGGMMFSSSYILVQFGFVLTFAVLLDTFIVRSLLVPAIMSFAEKWNWWPNKPPQ